MDVIEEVRTRLNIEDVIGEYVELKRAGRNYKALSPFTHEKTASFIVSPEKNIWKDFSSGKGGSVFDFIMEVEGLDFKESLELLAKKAGVDVTQVTSKDKSLNNIKDKLYEVNELAAKFYQANLKTKTQALKYLLNQRKFTKQSITQWRIGYSPNSGTALKDFLIKRGIKPEIIKRSGLISTYRNQNRDMFRGRIMLPLCDPQGRVIGFTARLLEDIPNAPKYINTPQTLLYDKSRHIYGLHLAKDAIRLSNYSVLVEGNLDVIASHQAKVTQAVATAGTALTEMQLTSLGRFSPDIRLAFDSDRAGLSATERAIELASKLNLTLNILPLPAGSDPDEIVRTNPKIWQEITEKPIYAIDWLIERYKAQFDLNSAPGKKQFSDKISPIISRLNDPVEKDHFINKISELLNISSSAFSQKLTDKKPAVKKYKAVKTDVVIDKDVKDKIIVQDKFLCLVLNRTTLRSFLKEPLSSNMFINDNAKNLYEAIKDSKDPSEKFLQMKKLEDYVKIETLLYEELYQGTDLNELFLEAARLQSEIITKYIKTEKYKLAESLRHSDNDQDIRTLQERDKQLNDLLNQVKGDS